MSFDSFAVAPTGVVAAPRGTCTIQVSWKSSAGSAFDALVFAVDDVQVGRVNIPESGKKNSATVQLDLKRLGDGPHLVTASAMRTGAIEPEFESDPFPVLVREAGRAAPERPSYRLRGTGMLADANGRMSMTFAIEDDLGAPPDGIEWMAAVVVDGRSMPGAVVTGGTLTFTPQPALPPGRHRIAIVAANRAEPLERVRLRTDVFVDVTPPRCETDTAPLATANRQPAMLVRVRDAESGIDEGTLQMTVDGEAIAATIERVDPPPTPPPAVTAPPSLRCTSAIRTIAELRAATAALGLGRQPVRRLTLLLAGIEQATEAKAWAAARTRLGTFISALVHHEVEEAHLDGRARRTAPMSAATNNVICGAVNVVVTLTADGSVPATPRPSGADSPAALRADVERLIAAGSALRKSLLAVIAGLAGLPAAAARSRMTVFVRTVIAASNRDAADPARLLTPAANELLAGAANVVTALGTTTAGAAAIPDDLRNAVAAVTSSAKSAAAFQTTLADVARALAAGDGVKARRMLAGLVSDAVDRTAQRPPNGISVSEAAPVVDTALRFLAGLSLDGGAAALPSWPAPASTLEELTFLTTGLVTSDRTRRALLDLLARASSASAERSNRLAAFVTMLVQRSNDGRDEEDDLDAIDPDDVAMLLGVTANVLAGRVLWITARLTPARPLADGVHRLAVSVADRSGNRSVPVERTVTVDAAPPRVIATMPAVGAVVAATSPVEVAFAPDISGVASFTLAVDGVDVSTAAVLGADRIAFANPRPMSDGGHVVAWSLTDRLGNRSDGTVAFFVDATAPGVIATTPAAGAVVPAATPIAIAFGPDTAGVTAFTLTLDGADVAPGARLHGDRLEFAPPGPLAEGEHRLAWSLTDAVGNRSAGNIQFAVDATPPVISETTPLPDTSGNAADVVIRARLTDAHAGLDPASVRLLLDGVETTLGGGLEGDLITHVWRDAEDGARTVAIHCADRAGNRAAAEWSFVVDRTAPVIQSVFPSEGLKIEDRHFTWVIVQAADEVSGVDPARCLVTIDDRTYTEPTMTADRLTFLVPDVPAEGVHRLRVEVCDRLGNSTAHETTFEILPSTAVQEEQYWQDRGAVLRARVVQDAAFRNSLLTDVGGAFAEVGLPLHSEVARLLPPPLTEDLAGFFTTVDSTKAADVMAGLNARVADALGRRDNARIAAVLERLGTTGIVGDDGGLSSNAKATVAGMLQDPLGMLASLGIEPTEEERAFLPPAFDPDLAEAYAEWISMTHSDNPEQVASERRTRLREIAARVNSDPALRYEFLTRPRETYRELYPDATARDLLALPEPLTPEEARRIIDPPQAPHAMPHGFTPHNSSDLVVGFSFELFNHLVELYFTTLHPGLLPAHASSTVTTGLPAPFDVVRYDVDIALPGDLTLVDAAARRVAVSATGTAVVTAADDATWSLGLVVTVNYAIGLDNEKVTLEFESVDVAVDAAGPGLDDPAVIAAIVQSVNDAVNDIYPRDSIFLMSQKPIDVPLPLADVAVNLLRIHVHDDQDTFGSGELYFGVTIDDKEYLFGQFDADSGDIITLNETYRLRSGGAPFAVRVRGKDRDTGGFPEGDDDLGSAGAMHVRSAPGRYALHSTIPKEVVSMVLDVVETTYEVVCWFVDTLVAIVDECGVLLGYERHNTRVCKTVTHVIMGLVRKVFASPSATYSLEYDITPLSPAPAVAALAGVELVPAGMYLSFDLAIPGIDDRKTRTSAIDFLGSTHMGVALSENLMDKILRTWWAYGAVPRVVTTPYEDLIAHAHMKLEEPDLGMQPTLMALRLSVSGNAGTSLPPFSEGPIGLPPQAVADIAMWFERRDLAIRVEKIRFAGGNWIDERIVNAVVDWQYNAKPETDKAGTVLTMLTDTRLDAGSGDLGLHPVGPITITDNEIVMNFSASIAPVLSLDATALDFALADVRTITLANTGNAMLNVRTMTIDDAAFTLDVPSAFPFALPPKGSVPVTVRIDPMWTGQHHGALAIMSNDPAHPVSTVTLTAIDRPRIEVVPAQLEFNDVVGRDLPLRIRNTGHAPLDVTAISPGTSCTLVPSFTPFTLAPREERIFTVHASEFIWTSALTISSSDRNVTVPTAANFAPIMTPIYIGFTGGGGY